jgi:hypothetical protein
MVVVAAAEFWQGFAKRVPKERWEELGATEGKGGGAPDLNTKRMSWLIKI